MPTPRKPLIESPRIVLPSTPGSITKPSPGVVAAPSTSTRDVAEKPDCVVPSITTPPVIAGSDGVGVITRDGPGRLNPIASGRGTAWAAVIPSPGLQSPSLQYPSVLPSVVSTVSVAPPAPGTCLH